MRVFVVNVGVNARDASKRGMRSPVFEDGSFEMLPIKEPGWVAAKHVARRYCDLPSWTGRARVLADYLPVKRREYAAHDDPDFARMTYGDIASSRAAGLDEVVPGDQILFLARLWEHRDGAFSRRGAFHFVGALFVSHSLSFDGQGSGAMPEEVRERVEMNAHAARARAGSKEKFRVLAGDTLRSARFERAIEVTPEVAGELFGGVYSSTDDGFLRAGRPLLNKNGRPRRFKRFGSITRAIQWFLDDSREDDRPWCDRLSARMTAAGRAVTPGQQ